VTVTVVVPSRDRPEALAACLAALARQTRPAAEVVVVDDASVDAAAVAAVVAAAGARLVRADGRGPAAARNRGANEATTPLLAFTDDDCRPEPGWLAALVTRLDAGAEVVAGPTRNARPDDPLAAASQAVTNHLVDWDLADGAVAFAPTSNLALRAEVHRALPFDETFPLAAGEDRDWCARVLAAGRTIAFEPTAVVDHHQDLTLRRFWRQHQRYGRGAHRHHADQPSGDRLQPTAFYTGLVRRGFAEGARAGALVLLAQAATAVGVAQEALAARRRSVL
jgi:glycosyltransferase involved in cell wall biosynthesis